MDWQPLLEEGETLRWSGRPAPRCFTFRRWVHSLFGLLLVPLAWVWYDGGRALAAARGEAVWGMVPWLGVIVALYFLAGHLVKERIAWERTFYAISDRRILATGGWPRRRFVQLRLAELRHVKFRPRGAQLGSLQLSGGNLQQRMTLSCLEHPTRAIELLEEVVRGNLQGEAGVERGE